ncbi:unnamed protein product [Clonostachys byssicola]|uniref:Uncharacterized protein n=1 Tax=Clonostachys byssicola TaxID=160290 RepID=A0A9N9U6B9_9HYPO|nr:unnamed protein product [Clonostachys byssicola]
MEIKIKYSAMLFEATQARGRVQNKRYDDGTVAVVFSYSEEGDDTNLDCSDDDPNPAVACDDIPFRKCHHGHENNIPDNVRHDKTDACKKNSAYAGEYHDPCQQSITSTGQDESLAGSLRRMIYAACNAQSKKGMNGSEDSRGPDQGGQEVDNDKEPKRKKMHRASLYTAQHKDGTFYHVRINSELGEEFRKIDSRADKKAFVLANGFPKGNRWGAEGRKKAQQEKELLEQESTGETPEAGRVS